MTAQTAEASANAEGDRPEVVEVGSAADFARGKRRSGPHFLELSPEELVSVGEQFGVAVSLTAARQTLGRWVSEGLTPFDQDGEVLPETSHANILRSLGKHIRKETLTVVERARDASDGFVKYLFRHPDGHHSEVVRIPLEKAGTYTLCLSSQIGCAMRCGFCATGKLGFIRNLEAWEIVAAFMTVRDEAPGRVTGAVFMGQGEPLHNYEEVMRAAERLSDPVGGRISKEAITISTVGLLPAIERYIEEKRPYKLIVSLTSAVPERRKELLPVAGSFSMTALANLVQRYQDQIDNRVTLAWVLMGGVNHGQDELDALTEHFGHLKVRINLIDLNADEFGRRATDDERLGFVRQLQTRGFATQRRYSGGKSKHAACGMLAATVQSETP